MFEEVELEQFALHAADQSEEFVGVHTLYGVKEGLAGGCQIRIGELECAFDVHRNLAGAEHVLNCGAANHEQVQQILLATRRLCHRDRSQLVLGTALCFSTELGKARTHALDLRPGDAHRIDGPRQGYKDTTDPTSDSAADAWRHPLRSRTGASRRIRDKSHTVCEIAARVPGNRSSLSGSVRSQFVQAARPRPAPLSR